MKTHEGAEAYRHSFLTPAMDGCWLVNFTVWSPIPRWKFPWYKFNSKLVNLNAIMDVLE
jgi:hypothetical protein